MGGAGCQTGTDTVLEFDVSGVVARVDSDRQVLEVVHDDIPGYMPAMQMPFPVERPELLEGLGMGDRVDFHLRVTDGAGVMTEIERLPGFLGPLPAFALEDLAGNLVSSSDFLGKVTIVNFWASWCFPCTAEMPILQQMAMDYPDTDFAVVGITQDPENREAIDQILTDLDIRYPILMTDGTLEMEVGGIPVIPGTLVVDRDGNVVDERLGIFEEAALRSVVEDLL
jgi:thiol-disulfide isomerase/thioredoxin